MPFASFTYPEVLDNFGLTQVDDFFTAQIPPYPLSAGFADDLLLRGDLAAANGNEKAISEFLVAPLLFEIWKLKTLKFGLYSGVELVADVERGLNGFCDFVITRGTQSMLPRAPLLVLFESKPERPRDALAQCIAAMVAAQVLNERAKQSLPAVYGIATSGVRWRFLRLQDKVVTLDQREYLIVAAEHILGILTWIIQHG